MEPQLEGCGKLATVEEHDARYKLQWSRNLRVAESAGPTTLAAKDVVLQWSRNLRVAESCRRRFSARGAHRFNGAAT